MTENTWVSLGLYLVGRPPLWSTPIFKAANRLLEVWDNCVLPSTPNPEPWNTRSWDKVPYVFPNTSWKGLVFWVCFFLGSSHNSHTSKPKVFVLSLGRCRILTDKIDVIESSHLEGNSRAGEAVSRVNNFCFKGWCFICGFMLFELTSFIFIFLHVFVGEGQFIYRWFPDRFDFAHTCCKQHFDSFCECDRIVPRFQHHPKKI